MWAASIVFLMTAQAGMVETHTGELVHPSETVNVVRDLPKPPVPQFTWKSDAKRYFAASTVDAGYLYLRPRLSLGYGAPHYLWMGVDLNPIFSRQGVGGWAGVRFALPYVDVRAGARAFYAFQRSFLPGDIDSFDRAALETSGGDNAHYITMETELTTGIATKYGEITLLGSASRVTGFDDPDDYVYEDTLRTIVGSSLVWRTRATYGFYPIPSFHQFTLGPAVDVIGVPTRDEILVRAGVVTRIVFNRAFEVRGSFVPTFVSRDRLGLITSDFTELGIRWRWASQ
jgi:hypothetical protein